MAFGIFIVGITFILSALCYDYYRGKQFTQTVMHKLTSYDLELNDARAHNRLQQDEIDQLKTKLQATFVDPVTGLLGWQLFEDRAKQALKESERHHFSMALAVVDIDDFKVVNDALGYEVGDGLLKVIGARLNECVREVDNVSRFTKDTFVVMLTQLSKPETVAIAAQRMLQSMAMPFQINGKDINVTACIGVALFPTDGRDFQLLLSHADHALHLAKIAGNHICQFYEERMQAQSTRDLILSNGLSREELFPFFSISYQPVLNAPNNKILSLEASISWQHEELGLVLHDELLRYAEKYRKLNALSIWMLKQACEEFLQLAKKDLSISLLAMPISIKQLENPHFIYEISQVLQSLAFPPTSLLLELRDHTVETSFDVLEKAFNMLQYLGIKLALDQFGGQSLSLRYLKMVQVDYLKTDASLVNDLLENPATKTLLQSMQQFAKQMQIPLIVNGVDTQEQADVLRQFGCQLFQGSAFCEPVSHDLIVRMSQLQVS